MKHTLQLGLKLYKDGLKEKNAHFFVSEKAIFP
jgi:hypothetical protein